MRKGEALGIFPPLADATVCEEEVQSLLLPHPPSPEGEAQGYNITSNISPFYIETVLGFEVQIQMVLKESVGALKASRRWRGWEEGKQGMLGSL